MIVSLARIAANRKNSLKSTGPKTEEGKQRSRANALKHGLCASIVVEEDLALVQERSLYWFNAVKPQDRVQAWLVDRAAILSIRIDRSERMERRARSRKALRAELGWDDDRALQAKRLGAMIASRPEEVVEELRRTPQGCEWLIGRWSMLARSADLNKSWTPDQAKLAFDLLGTPPVFRQGNKPGESIDLDGRLLDPADDPAAVARREIAGLLERRESVADLDEVNKALAMSDLDEEDDAELKRLRRYEATLYRRLRWCPDRVHFKSPDHRRTCLHLQRDWCLTPPTPVEVPPEPLPEPEPEPRESPVPGWDFDLSSIIAARKEKALKKAADRREAKRRKLERLRA